MNAERRDFDKEAVSWDEHPARVKLAGDIANALFQNVPVTSDMDILEFGCGTGLLTLQLQPLVRSIVAVDSSRGMLDVLSKKIARERLTNIITLHHDLANTDVLTGNYHLIVSSMTLHHISDIGRLFDNVHKVISPSGYLCIADLDLENGQFHEDNTGVFHFGFDRRALQRALTEAGFQAVSDVTAAEIMKPASSGEMRRFAVFLMIGRKGPDRGACPLGVSP